MHDTSSSPTKIYGIMMLSMAHSMRRPPERLIPGES